MYLLIDVETKEVFSVHDYVGDAEQVRCWWEDNFIENKSTILVTVLESKFSSEELKEKLK